MPKPKRKPVRKRKPKLKPVRRVSRATKTKISRGVKSYWRRVREIQTRFKLKDLRSAQRRYKVSEAVSLDRFERIALDRVEDRPKHISKSTVKKFGKKLERGKDAGRIVLYYDRLKKRPIKARQALKMRYDNSITRLALRAQELNITQQAYFAENYWPKYAKKRGYLTEFEAKRMIKKILPLRRKDDILRLQIKSVYGYS